MLNNYTIDSTSLPNGWTVGTIGTYCDLKSGYAFKSSWWTQTGYKVIKISNIIDNSIELESCAHVSPENAQKALNFFVKPGDILIAMTGATTGKIGIVPSCNEKIVVNQRVGRFFIGDSPTLKAPFLFATLMYERVANQLQPDGAAGSAQDNLSPNDIKDIRIVLPSEDIINLYNKRHAKHLKTMMDNCAEINHLKQLLNMLLSSLSGH